MTFYNMAFFLNPFQKICRISWTKKTEPLKPCSGIMFSDTR